MFCFAMSFNKNQLPQIYRLHWKVVCCIGEGKAACHNIQFTESWSGAPASQAVQRWCWRVRCWTQIKQHIKGAPGEWDIAWGGSRGSTWVPGGGHGDSKKGRVDLSLEWGHRNRQVLRKAALSHIPLATRLTKGQQWQRLLPHLHFRVTLASARLLQCPGVEYEEPWS